MPIDQSKKSGLFKFVVFVVLVIIVFITIILKKNSELVSDIISINVNETYNVKILLDENLDYEFYSQNQNIVSIDKETGILYPKQEGETVIEITNKNDGKVVKKIAVKINEEGTTKPVFEETYYTCKEGEVIETVAKIEGITIESYSANNDIVEVEEIKNGVCENCVKYQVKCQKKGTAILTVEADNKTLSSCVIKVEKVEKEEEDKIEEDKKEIEITDIKINYNEISIVKGEELALGVIINPENATDKEITWTSSDTNVVTVLNGVIKGVEEGKATIKVKTKNNKESICEVTVLKKVNKEIPVTGVSIISSKGTINVGETVNLVATLSPTDATNKEVTWSSSNTSIATVSSGSVKGLKEGTVIISATSNNGKVATTNITIVKKNTTTKKKATITVTQQTLTYDGQTHDVVASANSGVAPAIKYYTDSECKVETNTTAALGGAKEKNGAPKYSGTYYAQATVSETTNYTSASTGCVQALKINPLVKTHFIRVSRNTDGYSSEDAILLQYDDKFAMIDTGAHSGGTNSLPSYLKSLGVKKLEFVLITHMHADHIGGLYYGLLKQKNITINTLYVKQPIADSYSTASSSEDEEDDETPTSTMNRYKKIMCRVKRESDATINTGNEDPCRIKYKENEIYYDTSGNTDKGIRHLVVVDKNTPDITFGGMSIKLYNKDRYPNSNIYCDGYDCRTRLSQEKVTNTDNVNSIVEFITFTIGNKGYKVLLTGDLHDDIHSVKLLYNLSNDNNIKNLDVLKASHHGYASSALYDMQYAKFQNKTYNSNLYKNNNYLSDAYNTIEILKRLNPSRIIFTQYQHKVNSNIEHTIDDANKATSKSIQKIYVQGTGTKDNVTQNYGVILTYTGNSAIGINGDGILVENISKN